MPQTNTADFDIYTRVSELTEVQRADRWLTARWHDGFTARYHYVWLRDNCPCEGCVHQVTKEQTFELLSIDSAIQPASAQIIHGQLQIDWPHNHRSTYDSAWLRHHAYSKPTKPALGPDPIPQNVLWDATLGAPPTFDAAAVLTSDQALLDWASAIASHGCSLLTGVPDTANVGDIARRLGPVRDTNFGLLWDVVAEPDPVTNANTALPLPPHVDLPTREYQPGIQLLLCLVNEATGGESILVDGFRLADEVRQTRPDLYETLCTVSWDWSNRAKTSDYRFTSPILVTNPQGNVTEIRMGNWLRAPLTSVPFNQVEVAYEAYRYIFALSFDERFALRFRLGARDCMVFDNRRILHARGAFSGEAGHRHLQGCYTERDELYSRIRMLHRAQRVAAQALANNA
jgi:gamma-butyrobetaine dioxygenase